VPSPDTKELASSVAFGLPTDVHLKDVFVAAVDRLAEHDKLKVDCVERFDKVIHWSPV
jgi:hypothetical protein